MLMLTMCGIYLSLYVYIYTLYILHEALEDLEVKRSVECKVIRYQKGNLQVRVQFLLSRKKTEE